MWKHDQTIITDEELLKSLKAVPDGSITVLDGPSGCGKTRLLKQLEASRVRSFEKYTVEEIKDFIMERMRSSPLSQQNLAGHGLIAIEDVDFLGAAKSLQIEAAILIEKSYSRTCRHYYRNPAQ